MKNIIGLTLIIFLPLTGCHNFDSMFGDSKRYPDPGYSKNKITAVAKSSTYNNNKTELDAGHDNLPNVVKHKSIPSNTGSSAAVIKSKPASATTTAVPSTAPTVGQ